MPTTTEKRCIDWITKVLPRVKQHLKQKDLQEAQNLLKGSTGSSATRKRPRTAHNPTCRIWNPISRGYIFISRELHAEICSQLRIQKKIQAIKALREGYRDIDTPGFRIGLLDAKETVEYFDNWGMSG